MSRRLFVIGLMGIFALVLTFAAQAAEPQPIKVSFIQEPQSTPTAQATENPAGTQPFLPTYAPAATQPPLATQQPLTPVLPGDPVWNGHGWGMHGMMMNNGQPCCAGRMQGGMGMHGDKGMPHGMHGGMGMTTGGTDSSYPVMPGGMGMMGYGDFTITHEAMMTGSTPMHVDVAAKLGMTTQELYDQMAGGKTMAQIAAERGVSEQDLINAILSGRKAAFDQAVLNGHMSQVWADTMLANMESNVRGMVNGQGYWSGGWDMMWDAPTSP